MNKQLKEKLALLPDQPGCYLMKDRQKTVIYVGKAKVLKNRVRSYFTGSHDAKTQRLVTEIEDFEYIVTSSRGIRRMSGFFEQAVLRTKKAFCKG